MGTIQGAINSMIGSTSHAIMAVKGYQAMKAKQAAAAEKKLAADQKKAVRAASVQQMAAERAKQSAADAIEAKRTQRRNFMEYLKKQSSSLGKIGDLTPDLQKKIAQQFTPSMRKRLMDAADKEGKNGKHK